MPTILNTDNAISNQLQNFQIEGKTYFIRTYFNVRSGWYLDILDQFQIMILQGIKLMPDQNLTYRYDKEDLFSGDLWIIDNAPDKNNPTVDVDNFGDGKRFSLEYLTQSEMEEFSLTR